MSRIYEALQKAESERQLERESSLREQPAETDSSFREAAVEASSTLPAESFVQPDATLDHLPIEIKSFDLGGIARYPWAPIPQRLPALMERGLMVEQFRSLRSRLFELRDIRPLKSILVTSGMPQEGKSFVAANLAISLARHKSSKVLLVDGDMRRYTLHELLGTTSHPGLADYLAGRVQLTEVMQRPQIAGDKDRPGVLPNLTFIPGGNGGDKAADLSGNPRFADLIKTASRYFDWIVVDSSPVIPVSDAVNLSRSCDGVLLVARNGVTKFPVAQRAQSEMKASNVLGFVLNAADNSPSANSYYGYDTSYS